MLRECVLQPAAASSVPSSRQASGTRAKSTAAVLPSARVLACRPLGPARASCVPALGPCGSGRPCPPSCRPPRPLAGERPCELRARLRDSGRFVLRPAWLRDGLEHRAQAPGPEAWLGDLDVTPKGKQRGQSPVVRDPSSPSEGGPRGSHLSLPFPDSPALFSRLFLRRLRRPCRPV